MVRFSDMLGGNSDREGAPAATVPAGAPIDDTDPEIEPGIDPIPAPEANAEVPAPAEAPFPSATETDLAATAESPRDVLDRLTQYATSARAAERELPTPDGPGEPLPDAGDDLLPHAKGRKRKS
jgi:hypothetical protein